MNIILILKAIILGAVEGLTEFIPVSSTAHLLITAKLINFTHINNNVFEIVIQLGAIMAICFFYKDRLKHILLNFFKEKKSRNFSYNILLAFLPSVIFGILLYKIIKTIFFSLDFIAFALVIGGIIIILVEKSNIQPKFHDINKLSKKRALLIGLFQIISMIPGVSRSGATIIGGLILKLDRKAATEFSFFLAIPTIFAATIYDLYKNISILNSDNLALILIGFISAFFASLFVIKWLLNFVSKNNFMIFAYYRILIGFIMFYILYFR